MMNLQAELSEVNSLDYSPSSGSIGVAYFPDGPQEHDGRAKTRTTFRPSDTIGTSKNWDRMQQIQDGLYADDMNTVTLHVDQERDLGIFIEELKLRPREKEYAEYVLKRMQKKETETDHQYSSYQSSEGLLLGIITYSVNKYGRRIRPDENYKNLREALQVDKGEVRNVRQNIRDYM
jgi:hypothetical protein